MAQPFVRIDLAPGARDFQPVALAPGLPMLDPSNSNDRILRGWLGEFVAEPEVDPGGGTVGFLIPARDAGAGTRERPIVDACVPVMPKDLRGPLRAELDELRGRIERVEPRSATERDLHRALVRALADQLDPENPRPGCHLFHYRGDRGKRRLIWCWGYQRRDDAPGAPVVRDGFLHVLRPGERPAGRAAAPSRRRRAAWPSLALALLLAGAVGLWAIGPRLRRPVVVAPPAPGEHLVVSPETWSGPQGGRVEFAVRRVGPKGEEDASPEAVASSDDPRVVAIDRSAPGVVAVAGGPGRATLHFAVGPLATDATVVVRPPTRPESIGIEPSSLTLGVGATARLRASGHYEGGEAADLSDRVEWSSEPAAVVFVYRGLVEALAEGTAAVRARYRPAPGDDPVEATLEVKVVGRDYKALELSVAPAALPAGGSAVVRAFAVAGPSARDEVTRSSRLRLEVAPAEVAAIDGGVLRGLTPGRGRLAGTFGGLSASAEFEVRAGSAPADLVVAPKDLALIVGEVARLDVAGGGDGPVKIESGAPGVVEVGEDGRLVGMSPGEAKVEVTRGAGRATVSARVTADRPRALAIDPGRIRIAVDDAVPVRVLGRLEEGRSAELAPDRLTWERLPSPRSAAFDPASMTLRGLAPTDSPEELAVRLGGLRASAPVEVVAAPFALEVTPSGPLSIPAGQVARLRAWSVGGDGRRVEVPADRVEWHAAPASIPGLKFSRGEAEAVEPGAGPVSVRARYLGRESAEVVIRTEAAAPATLALHAPRPVLLVGESGRLSASAASGDRPVELGGRGATFASSDPKVLDVDPTTGAFRAAGPGRADVTATHPSAAAPAKATLRVVDPARARLVFRPAEAEVAVGTRVEMALALAVPGDEGEGGGPASVPLGAEDAVQYTVGDPEAVAWSPPTLTGRKPAGSSLLSATALGLSASARVRVVAAAGPDGKAPSIRVVPDRQELAPGQSLAPKVEQQAGGPDGAWREVEPEVVRWRVPEGVLWTPPAAGLRPTVALPVGATGERPIVAAVDGREATLTVSARAGDAGPDPDDPKARLVLVREPAGASVPVGTVQRYSILIQKDGKREPAAHVEWPADFENESVAWHAPELAAKRPGHVERLTARVGSRSLPFSVVTSSPVAPHGPAGVATARRPGRSAVVRPGGVGVGGVWLGGPYPGLAARGYGYHVGPGFAGWHGYGPGYVGWPGYGPWWGGFADHLVAPGYAHPWVVGPAGVVARDGPVVVDGPRVAGRAIDLGTLPDDEVVRLDRALPLPDGKPDAVAISPAAGRSVSVPVGASSREFRVEARYARGPARDVTGTATLSVEGDPAEAAAAVEGGRIVGVREGSAVVRAEFLGVRSAEGLPVDVTAGLALDAIQLQPSRLTLRVGESASLQAIGMKDGHPSGEITGRGDLAWKSRSPGVLRVDGPVVTALAEGTGGVTVQAGPLVSGVAEVAVAGRGDPAGPALRAVPGTLTMRVGETRRIGVDVSILRGDVDFSRQCSAAASAPDVVGLDERAATLTGLAPGRAEVVFAHGDRSATLAVEVRPDDRGPPGRSSVAIDPAGGVLAIGEARALRVDEVGESGERVDRTGSALLESSGAAAVSGRSVVGMAPGRADVLARLPGVAAPGRAPFVVRDEPIESLSVSPGRIALAVGQGRRVEVGGGGVSRRFPLGEHPDLEVTVHGPDPGAVEVRGAAEVVGKAPGRAVVRFRWRGKAEAEVPVEVSAAGLTGLAIEPASASVAGGDTVAFRVLAERGGALVPLGPEDGVEIQAGPPSVAVPAGGQKVRGVGPGVADVVARLGDRRAEARLTVTAPRAEPPSAAPARDLRFRPEALRLALGAPGLGASVLAIRDDGTGDDVSGLVTLDLGAAGGAVEAEKTATGPILRPSKAGRGEVKASLGALTTSRPLIVEVVEAARDRAELRATPDPLTVRVGESAAFRKVELIPAPGLDPVPVPFRVEAGAGVVGPSGTTAVRGLKAGLGRVEVVVADPGGTYDGLRRPFAVEVAGPPAEGPGLALILAGPDRATVGEDVRFRAELAGGGASWPVTNDATSLALDPGEEGLAEVRPGGVVHALKPGRVTIRARHGGLLSGRRALVIEPPAEGFRRLEVEIDRRPMAVGEVRFFHVWGDPGGGGPRQNLTGLLDQEAGAAARPRLTLSGDGVADRRGPAIVGRAPGSFTIRAGFAGLESAPATIPVVTFEGTEIEVAPATSSIRVGERLPAPEVVAWRRRDDSRRRVDATLTSLDESVLAPDPRAPGQFIGRAPGRARIRARFGGREATAEVDVVPDRFESIKILGGPRAHDDGTFDLEVEVVAPRAAGASEYRIVPEGAAADRPWEAARPDGDRVRAVLRSPRLPIRRAGLYQLLIEARGPDGRAVERYPYAFRLVEGDFRIEPVKGP